VYGRELQLVCERERWTAYYCSDDGKRRRAPDIHIPDGLGEEELLAYIADLCHEWATPTHNDVRALPD
jgi:hypothetical protein